MMVKERFIEQYGVPRFTITSGGSGGSMQQHFIAQNYPGLIDAITPDISYSDLVSILPDVVDCGLLTTPVVVRTPAPRLFRSLTPANVG